MEFLSLSLICSPSQLSYEDTYNTLKYADRAKNIRLDVSAIFLVIYKVAFRTFYVAFISFLSTEGKTSEAGQRHDWFRSPLSLRAYAQKDYTVNEKEGLNQSYLCPVQALQVSCCLHSPPAVKHGPCLLPLRKSIQAFETKHLRKLFSYLLLGAHDQRLGAEQDQLPCRSTGTSPGNCQEMETCMVQACHTPQQPLQNHPSGHLGEWVTPLSAEEMVDGQHQRVEIPAHASTAHKGLLQKRLEEDLC